MKHSTSIFNPRARTGRDAQWYIENGVGACFNPRARAGHDALDAALAAYRGGVSIHAPARGATAAENHSALSVVVSIHAPARGATWIMFCTWEFAVLFQSTRPLGARRPPNGHLAHLPVSIHAPARGATPAARYRRPRSPVSIHAPARGATYICTMPYRRIMFHPRACAGRDQPVQPVR